MKKKMVSDAEMDGSDREGRKRRRALSLEDCRCPVCLEIFLEPVTLPCTHTFCKVCFLESVDKAALCCPLCRRRVSTWARLNSRKNSLVDQTLWEQIQTCFPLQCQRRLTGQEEEEEQPGVCSPRVSQPGELKQEYEDQVTKLMEEKRFHEEEERKASEDFIQRLLAEEENLRQEETRRREGDEKLARLLSSQLNSAPVSQGNVGTPHVNNKKKLKKEEEVGGGQMEKFLFPLPSNNVSSSCSFISNKENILLLQVEQVGLQVERPPPALDYYGQTAGSSFDLHLQVSAEGSSQQEVTSRGCPSSPEVVREASIGVAGLEAELMCRQRQEEEDRRLALLLQKELDQEEKQRATNRRKGSSDPYLLRHQSRQEMKSGSCDTATRPSRRTTKISSPPSSSTKDNWSSTKTSTPSSSNSRTKQATLTEMFSFRAADSSSPVSQ